MPVPMGEKGWPRPRAPWRGTGHPMLSKAGRCPGLPDRLPVPWLVDLEGLGWTGFRDDACEAARARLCMVCGEPVTGTLVLGYYSGGVGRCTSGPGGHPRCMLLAATTCPRLVEDGADDGQVAWHFDGEGPGHEVPLVVDDGYGSGEAVSPNALPLTLSELRALVREQPRSFPPTGGPGLEVKAPTKHGAARCANRNRDTDA